MNFPSPATNFYVVTYELTAQDEKGLYAGVERMYKREPDSRTSMLGPLEERLHRWTRAGQFGYVFDNVQDSLTFSRFQTFNFDGMQQYPDVSITSLAKLAGSA